MLEYLFVKKNLIINFMYFFEMCIFFFLQNKQIKKFVKKSTNLEVRRDIPAHAPVSSSQ